MSLTTEIENHLVDVAESLMAAGRSSALALLGERTVDGKARRAEACVLYVEQSARVAELLDRYFQTRTRLVAWRSDDAPSALDAAPEAVVLAAELALDKHDREVAASLQALAPLLKSTQLSAPVRALVREIEPRSRGRASAAPRGRAPRAALTEPLQTVRGPRHVGLDPLFSPTYSLLDERASKLQNSHRAPYFWNLALRECMASELCALSLVEYDGLPLTFYRDFAKQAWDEMRHARFFLDLGLAGVEDFVRTAPADHPLLPGARCYLETGRGLPVPRERNLFELMWNATLEERIVLMHIETETPGIAGFVKELKSDYAKEHPAFESAMELAMRDEVSHARLGKTWLEYLVPKRDDRKAQVAAALELRGLLILTAISHYDDASLPELLDRHASA